MGNVGFVRGGRDFIFEFPAPVIGEVGVDVFPGWFVRTSRYSAGRVPNTLLR